MVEEMGMGMDIWTDRMRVDLAVSTACLHLSLLSFSRLTLHSEQVPKPFYCLFVIFLSLSFLRFFLLQQ